MGETENYFPPIPAYDVDHEAYLNLNKVDWSVDPKQAALLIYDMQKWYVERYGAPGDLIPNINALRTAARDAGMPVIFAVADPVHHVAERGIALDMWGPGIGAAKDAEKGDDDMHPDLTPDPQDFILPKRKYDAFFETDFEAMLRRMNRTQLVICGNYANHGCMVTAVAAYIRNFRVFYTSDALGALDFASHDMAMRWVADVCGKICLTKDVVADIKNQE